MTGQEQTFELTIGFRKEKCAVASLKQEVKDWLTGQGEDNFVEGVIADIDIEFDYSENAKDQFLELGGEMQPIVLYKYDKSLLLKLQEKLELAFGQQIDCSLKAIESQSWKEGWKESFKPFSTQRFCVFPPWEKNSVDSALIPIEIEPGMAFGTGQHETTQLCLRLLEDSKIFPKGSFQSVLDVGTGTGILAIATQKMGATHILATDIDSDAVAAAKENAKINTSSFETLECSVPKDGSFDLVIANILWVVIEKIFADLCARMKPGGRLLLSGVLSEQRSLVDEANAKHGMVVAKELEENGWLALVLNK